MLGEGRAAGTVIAPALRRDARSCGLPRWNQVVFAISDQIGPAHFLKSLSKHRPVFGIVVSQKRFVKPPLLNALGDKNLLAGAADAVERVLAGVVHGRGVGHGRGQEGLHLISPEAMTLEPDRKVQHILIGRPRMGCDEIGDQVLFLTGFFRIAVKHGLEGIVGAYPGLHHLGQGP